MPSRPRPSPVADRPETVSTIKDLAQIKAALLDRLGLAEVTVVGNSVGGFIAQG
ncbi:MAG: hypothetical protein IIZ13_03845 [Renibacterium sp.]|nr:hypothetical protein [Renibacterium sp.]